MAAKKSSQNPHQWPNGEWHSISWERHLQNQAASAYNSGNPAGWMGSSFVGGPSQPAPAPSAPAPAPGPAVPPTIEVTPPPPPPLDPFFTPEDIQAMGEWMRNVGDNRATVDSQLNTSRSDTTYQAGQLNQQAKHTASQAADNMAARGLFQSSIKDAALFDIEAQRATQEGYLNDRLKQITSEHDAWVSKYGGTMSNGTKIAGSEDEAKTSGAPLGTAVAQWAQEWQGKAAQNAKEVNDNRPAPQPITVPNPAFQGLSSAGTATGIKAPATAGPPKGLGSVPLGAGTAKPDPNRPNVATGIGAIPTPKKKKTYVSGVKTP